MKRLPYLLALPSASLAIFLFFGPQTAHAQSCMLEDVCGDGRISGTEVCDDGGICTGSSWEGYNGFQCFNLDPSGNRFFGVQRCVATGGTCVPQDGDGCKSDCSQTCRTDSSPCITNSDCGTCTDASCINGECVSSASTCGNWILEGAEECDDGNTADGDGCSATCTNEGLCPSCSPCTTSAVRWQFALSGLDNGVCDQCDMYNGQVEIKRLTEYASGCVNIVGTLCDYCWGSTDMIGCSGLYAMLYWNDPNWELVFDLTGTTTTEASYIFDTNQQQWNCNGQNVMQFESSGSECSNWPGTITVYPVGSLECTQNPGFNP